MGVALTFSACGGGAQISGGAPRIFVAAPIRAVGETDVALRVGGLAPRILPSS